MQATPCKDCGAPFECELAQRNRVELRWTCGRSVVVTPPGYVAVFECKEDHGYDWKDYSGCLCDDCVDRLIARSGNLPRLRRGEREYGATARYRRTGVGTSP